MLARHLAAASLRTRHVQPVWQQLAAYKQQQPAAAVLSVFWNQKRFAVCNLHGNLLRTAVLNQIYKGT